MYKAVKNGKIIDAYEQLQYVKYDQNAKMFLRCNKDDNPQGIIQRNGIRIYHVKDLSLIHIYRSWIVSRSDRKKLLEFKYWRICCR